MEATPCGTLDPTALFASLAAVIWDERDALDRLLFRLVQLRLLLQAAATGWLGKADDDLRAAHRHVQACELVRVAAVAELADALDLRPRCTLADLAAAVPEPWHTVLAEHRSALVTVAAELDAALECVAPDLDSVRPQPRTTAELSHQSLVATTRELHTAALTDFLA